MKLSKDLKIWKEKHKFEVEEKESYHKKALDAMRKNKLLKVAIGRMHAETVTEKQEPKMLGNTPDEVEVEDVQKDNTFLTGANIEEKLDDDAIDNVEN